MSTETSQSEHPPGRYTWLFGRLTDREQALLVAAVPVTLVVGMWLGTLLVPTQALAVPTEAVGRSGEYLTPAYRPASEMLILASGFLPLVGGWLALGQLRGGEGIEQAETED